MWGVFTLTVFTGVEGVYAATTAKTSCVIGAV